MPKPLSFSELFDGAVGAFELGPTRRPGEPARVIGLERELGKADLELLLNPPPKAAESQMVKKLRSSHHALARLLAAGERPQTAALVTGYSASRIAILQNDPSFKELVAYYAGQVKEVYLDVHQRLAALGMDSIEELQDRLENEPESFRNRELMELVEMVLDRSVAPPRKGAAEGGSAGGAVNVQVNFVAPKSEVPTITMGPAEGRSAPAFLPQAQKETS